MLAMCANAQDAKTNDGKQKGYFNITELGIYFGKASREREEPTPGTPAYYKGNSTMTTARTVNGVFLNPHLSLGIGLGLENHTTTWDVNYAALLYFLDTRLYLSKNKPNSLFVFFDVGFTSVLGDHGLPSNLISTGAGYKFRVGNALLLNVSGGYDRIHRTTGGMGSYDFSTTGIKAGILF